MAQLISLRQRIKAIEMIKKITHAMRLISMSTHGHLKHNADHVDFYTQSVRALLKTCTSLGKKSEQNTSANRKNELVLLIGSQKGLCGTFNNNLLTFINNYYADTSVDLIVVGKKIVELVQHQSLQSVKHLILELNYRSLLSITNTLATMIEQELNHYTSITIISTVGTTFFVQKPRRHALFPLSTSDQTNDSLSDYIWQEDRTSLYASLLSSYIQAEVYYALFQSLIAEQAARFISMDSSTRNAKKLLEATKLQYNKLRQATITKELTELSSSY